MIVPSNRLLLATAVVLIPLSVAVAFSSPAVNAGLILIGLLLAAIVLDALLSLRMLKPLHVEAPDVIRLTKWQESLIELRVQSTGAPFKAVRFGIPLPEQIPAQADDFTLQLPKANCWYRLHWKTHPTSCGKFNLPACCLETTSRLGFWQIQQQFELNAELRVYPNLRKEQRAAAALFLNRGDNGGHLCRQISRGREFEKLREYLPGDTYQDIHWKTTAKRQHPVTKVYQIERTQEIYVVLDSSRLSARKVPLPDSEETVTLLERYINSALMLAMAAEKQGDLFGLIEFGAKPNLFLKAARGKSHFDTCRNALYTLLPEEASPDFTELVSFIRTRLRKRALIVFLTSLDDAAEEERFKESISLLSHHHLTVVNMLAPEGAKPLFSGEPAQTQDELYTHLSGHLAWRKLHELERHLKTLNVQFNLLDNQHLSTELITQYMNIKQRQLI